MQPLQPGDPAMVGRYRLGGRLGHGGMGQVYWGRSPSGRPVAIKVVHPHLAGQPDFRRRFAQEVDAARRVSGFHTAPVVDADPAGDPPWLVTAYVAGPSLAQAVQRAGPFPVPTLRVLGVGLAEALEAVHAAGLVHRDLKPANILLVDDGPRVIDFGIARALDPAEAHGLTGTGAAIGTPRFMAPEQFGDEPITGAADVFAWGTVICAAAGAHPFGEGSAATIVGAILTRPPRLDAVPKQLQELVSTALEREPARRPTPVQLIEALSDGTSSHGWLPPPVQAMLPEHTLPDAAPPGERTEIVSTEVIDGGRTARIAPPPHQQPVQQTRQFMGLPPEPVPEPLPPPSGRRRGAALTIGIAVGAMILVVVALIVGINLSGARTATPPAAAPSTAETTEEPPSDSTPTAAGDVTPESFLGNWQTVDGSDQNVAVSIDPLEEGTTAYGLSITIVDATACNGGSYKGTGTGSPSGDVLATSWVVACDTDSSFTDSFTRTYTFDAATGQLTDDQGLVFSRQ
ncbi:serine/threonine-protein kinase [Pseudonocardia sp. TRM90224]|uniref:serine/threonine-protein kinase n=1 Tax=Pseudonocardia sp. TRM90224 TaxID=2812678 RepID=UPI001E2F7608|nr:serine/threonine-protein kinase [Pseudonocardia sp. TRM90224]